MTLFFAICTGKPVKLMRMGGKACLPNIEMKLYLVIVLFLVCLTIVASAQAQRALLWDDFEDASFADNWKISWKNAGDFEQKEGVLKFVPGGAEIATIKAFDFSGGVTFESIFTRTNDGDFALFVNEEPTAPGGKNIWNSPAWIGIFVAGGKVQVRITQQSQPKAVPEAQQGTPMKLSLFLDKTEYKAYLDGNQFDEDKHGLNFSKGYMIFSSAAAPGQMDNTLVYHGDYQPDAFEKGRTVEVTSKLAIIFGKIKKGVLLL